MEFQVSPGSVFHDDQRIQRQNGGLPENSTVTTFLCGGQAKPRGPGGSMKYQFVYLNVVTVCLNELDSVCLNGWAGQGKPSRR